MVSLGVYFRQKITRLTLGVFKQIPCLPRIQVMGSHPSSRAKNLTNQRWRLHRRGTIVRQRKPQGSITFFGASGEDMGSVEYLGGKRRFLPNKNSHCDTDQYGGLPIFTDPRKKVIFYGKRWKIYSRLMGPIPYHPCMVYLPTFG